MSAPLPSLIKGLPVEYVTWRAQELMDGTKGVLLRELRIVAGADEPGADDQRNEITRVARISWRVDTGEVLHLWTMPRLRRQGFATALWDLARGVQPTIRHSAHRTREGQAWALAVAARDGDTLPTWRLA